MKLTKHKKSLNSKMNIAPMIDVVFLLIIFCLYLSPTTHYIKDNITLPDNQTTAEQPDPDPDVMVINITEGGLAYLNSTPVDLDTARTMLKAHRDRYGENAKVLIRGDRRTQWIMIQEILRVCNQVGITQTRHSVLSE